jgi:hypothetical protein
MLRNIASCSFGPNGRLTRAVQSRDHSIGQGVKVGRSNPSSARRAERLPHFHSSARSTKFARRAFRSTQRQTVRRCSCDCTGIETVLAETVAFNWFALRLHEVGYASQRTSEDGLTIKQADLHPRRIDRAHRWLMSNLKTLATVGRLALAALQINVARPQVNQVTGGLAPGVALRAPSPDAPS